MMLGSLLQLFAQRDDLADDHRGSRQRFQDSQLAALDSFGDLDFSVARQQRNRTHFAQVHADGIIGLLESAGSQIELDVTLGGFAVELLFAGNLVETGKP